MQKAVVLSPPISCAVNHACAALSSPELMKALLSALSTSKPAARDQSRLEASF